MAVFEQPTSVPVKWLPFTNRNSDEAQTSEHDGDIRMGDSTGVSASLGGEIFSERNVENQTLVIVITLEIEGPVPSAANPVPLCIWNRPCRFYIGDTPILFRQKGEKSVNEEGNVKVIMEYLVNISKRRAFWSLNKDILKITVLTTNMPYPSRKIWRIRACTHQRPQRKHDQYAVSSEDQYAVLEIMTKVIKGEFEKLEDLNDKDVSLTCGISLEVFNNEFNWMSGMNDDLFTYEVEVANIPCDSKKDDDSEHSSVAMS
ncbi:hypothetical protein Tco_1030338 [Tanacetum coccineum]|uniref:Uncharacterized protein n=1 Tax=Tanacetum coccineum TaxID=301880 RepID=A0ABQ5G7S0_9ASTR